MVLGFLVSGFLVSGLIGFRFEVSGIDIQPETRNLKPKKSLLQYFHVKCIP